MAKKQKKRGREEEKWTVPVKELTGKEKLGVMGAYYISRYPTAEQAHAALVANHPELSELQVAEAMSEGIKAYVLGEQAEEAYMFAHGGQLEEEEQQLAEEATAGRFGEMVSEYTIGGLPIPEPQQGGFADVVWQAQSGKEFSVRTDFGPGTGIPEIMEMSHLQAELVAGEYPPDGHGALDESVDPIVLGIYYTR